MITDKKWTPPFDMDSLFGYPYSPARGKTDTSDEAAESLKTPTTLRNKALELITISGQDGLTADEVAELMGKTGLEILSIRPRITELSKQEKIEDSGIRRFNSSGKRAIVWRVKH